MNLKTEERCFELGFFGNLQKDGCLIQELLNQTHRVWRENKGKIARSDYYRQHPGLAKLVDQTGESSDPYLEHLQGLERQVECEREKMVDGIYRKVGHEADRGAVEELVDLAEEAPAPTGARFRRT